MCIRDRSYLDDDAASGERVGSASGRRGGVNPDSLPQAVGEVGIVGGSTFALSPREISSIKTAVPKLGSSADFPLWKRRFEGFALSNDCMQSYTSTIDMPVGDPSVSSQFLIDQGFSEISVRRARIAWTCFTESITDRELLSRVFDTNSPSAGWRFLLNCFVPKTLAEKSK